LAASKDPVLVFWTDANAESHLAAWSEMPSAVCLACHLVVLMAARKVYLAAVGKAVKREL